MHLPSSDEALQFAVMLSAGVPAEHAICYFTETSDAAELALILNKWQRSPEVQRAQKIIDGKGWQDMTLEEKIDAALNQHYASLAYLLKTVNYATAGQSEKPKLDSARSALEAKKAGTAGREDPLSRFLADFTTGKMKSLGGRAQERASITVVSEDGRKSQ